MNGTAQSRGELLAQAERMGFELLTALGAARLLNITKVAVRAAVREGRIEAPYTVIAHGQEIELVRLGDALLRWATRWCDDPDFEARLAEMRAEAHVFYVSNASMNGGLTYSVMNDRPFVVFGEIPEEG